ncbi:MAG: GIY-YIG nuclease family protein [Candidatus Dojkabacteria bacterium]
MNYVYVLKSLSSSKLYIGQTHNLELRLKQHNGEGLFSSGYTRGKGPWSLIHYESFTTRSEAIKREKFLKTGKGREFINNIMVESA